jgi:hypothetical protein
MTYFEDLSFYEYALGPTSWKGQLTPSDKVLNIGWLSSTSSFERGSVPEEVLEKLFELCKTNVNQARGFQVCEICPSPRVIEHFSAERDGERRWLGSAEIRVRGRSGIHYACPNMIYHYMKDHRYRPPQEFIDAVLQMPPSVGLIRLRKWARRIFLVPRSD